MPIVNMNQFEKPRYHPRQGKRRPFKLQGLPAIDPYHRALDRREDEKELSAMTGDEAAWRLEEGELTDHQARLMRNLVQSPVTGQDGAVQSKNYATGDEQEFYRRLDEVERHMGEADVHGQNPPPDTGMRSDGLRDALMELHDRGKIDLFSHMADFLSGIEEDEAGEHSDIHRMAHNWARKNGYF